MFNSSKTHTHHSLSVYFSDSQRFEVSKHIHKLNRPKQSANMCKILFFNETTTDFEYHFLTEIFVFTKIESNRTNLYHQQWPHYHPPKTNGLKPTIGSFQVHSIFPVSGEQPAFQRDMHSTSARCGFRDGGFGHLYLDEWIQFCLDEVWVDDLTHPNLIVIIQTL